VLTSPDGTISTTFPDETESPLPEPPRRSIHAPVPAGTIVVDGKPADWIAAGIEPLIVDPLGDHTPPGLDAYRLRVAYDAVNVYFLFEFAGRPVNYSHLLLDVDINPGTGCVALGVGFEYGVTFVPSSIARSYIGDAHGCFWSNSDFPGALTAAVSGRFIEASVSIDTLSVLNPMLTAFDITCANDICGVARMCLSPAPPALPSIALLPPRTWLSEMGPAKGVRRMSEPCARPSWRPPPWSAP